MGVSTENPLFPMKIIRVFAVLATACAGLFMATPSVHAQTPDAAPTYEDILRQIGSLSANPYAPMSTSSPSAQYDPNSPANPYSTYGSRYSTQGARNPYTTEGADIVGADGQYLGKLNSNSYDPNSVANPYGQYGSRYSPTSVNNPYGQYGSAYSPYSANNPYATQPPGVYAPTLSLPALPALPSLPELPGLP